MSRFSWALLVSRHLPCSLNRLHDSRTKQEGIVSVQDWTNCPMLLLSCTLLLSSNILFAEHRDIRGSLVEQEFKMWPFLRIFALYFAKHNTYPLTKHMWLPQCKKGAKTDFNISYPIDSYGSSGQWLCTYKEVPEGRRAGREEPRPSSTRCSRPTGSGSQRSCRGSPIGRSLLTNEKSKNK